MGLIIEGYVVEKLIKEGGFGAVYRVKRVLDKKILALKILKGNASMGVKSQFYKEAKLLSKFNHPNIIKVHGIENKAPLPAILMEYFESETLRALILNQSPLIAQKGVGIFRKVSEALKYLHQQNIIHKDLKPENILVSPKGEVRLIDFSIAEKLGFLSFLKRRKLEGTPLFMAPEQIKKKPLDCRTDIYSLGATFYYFFSGKQHITAGSEKALLQQQLRASIPSMRRTNKEIHYQLDKIILRMLRKRPEERYQSIAEMLFDLNRHLPHEYLSKADKLDDTDEHKKPE